MHMASPFVHSCGRVQHGERQGAAGEARTCYPASIIVACRAIVTEVMLDNVAKWELAPKRPVGVEPRVVGCATHGFWAAEP